MDTVDYLETQFKEQNLRVIKYSSKTQYSKNVIKANFDAGYNSEKQKDNYDLLVATDAISEGFSLHRAGTIYNYDIPYNPTRVIQRVGRINRINKKVFDRLNIYNFFPSVTGEALSRTKSIATFKMLLIQTIFGSDTKILTTDEITEGYLTDEYRKAKAEAESPSWETEFRNEYYRIEKQDRGILKQALELPQRCRTGRKMETVTALPGELFEGADKKGVLLFSEKGDSYRFSFADENGGSSVLSAFEGISLFKTTRDEKALPVNDSFYPLYERAKGSSGVSAEKSSHSKNVTALIINIKYLIKQLSAVDGESGNIDYLKNLMKITGELDSLPLYYIRQLLDVDIQNIAKAVAEFKDIVAEEYLSIILEKDDKIVNKIESIILSEQFI
jgi:superfamily II DNA/RNA helicase